ncbi:hypothetical protein MRX96_044072 [Rhipicephalus microplus]
MLVLDLQPYSCVENRGFKELMNHMEPLYKITQPHYVFKDNHPGVHGGRSLLTAGNIVTARRQKLTSDHVQQLLCLHENL